MVDCNCKTASAIFISVWAVVTLITTVTIAFSFAQININQVGLLYDIWQQKVVENAIYYPGRYWLGFTKYFTTYPVTAQNLSFFNSTAIKCITADETDLNIELVIIYKLRPELLYEHYNTFKAENYIDEYTIFIKEIVENIASTYNITDFIFKRNEISNAMAVGINLKMRTDMYSELIYFQLYNLQIEPYLEAYFERSLDYKYQVLEDNLSVNSKQLEIQLENVYSVAKKQSANILSLANSNSDYLINQAKSETIKNNYLQLSQSYLPFIYDMALNFTQKELNKFILYQKLDDMTFANNVNNIQISNNFSHGVDNINTIGNSANIPLAVVK